MNRWVTVLALMVVACSANTVATTPTETAVPSTAATATTTTTETTRTTVIASGVVGLRPGSLVAGQIYSHSFDLVEMRIAGLQEAGWLVRAVNERFVIFERDSIDSRAEVVVTMKPFDSEDDVIGLLKSHPTVSDMTDPVPAIVGGWSGVTLDVRIPPPEAPPAQVGQGSTCTSPKLDAGGALGEVFLESQLVGCAVNRVWIVTIAGTTVVVHAADQSGEVRGEFTAGLDDVEPLIHEFLAAITFSS